MIKNAGFFALALTAALAACTSSPDQTDEPVGVRVEARIAGGDAPPDIDVIVLDDALPVAFDDESIDPEGGSCGARIQTCDDGHGRTICTFFLGSSCTMEQGLAACDELFRTECGIG